MSERNDRKVYVGRVVSDKMDKTITVLVETMTVVSNFYDYLYRSKKLDVNFYDFIHMESKYSKKYKTHDENNSAKLGDIVKIQETRPLSATKRFRLVEIVEESVII